MPETPPPLHPAVPPLGHPADDRDVRLRRALAIVWGPWVHDISARPRASAEPADRR